MILLTTFTSAYCLLLIWFARGLNHENKISTKNKSDENFVVSVVIAVRNEEKTIGTLLTQLSNQDYPTEKYEIVVVNDQSTDSSGNIITEHSRYNEQIKYVEIDHVPNDWAPKKWALNQAAQIAKGDILLFTDGDCNVGTSWISSMTSPFHDNSVGMVSGPSPLVSTDLTYIGKMLLLDSLAQDALAAGAMARGIPLTCSGRNLAVRRQAFNSVGGYEQSKGILSGDDDLLMHRLNSAGWKIKSVLTPEATATSAPPDGIGAFIQQRLRFASKGLVYYGMPETGLIFRLMLPFLWTVNLSVITGQIAAIWTLQAKWLLPWIIKMIADGVLLGLSVRILGRQFSPVSFLIAELWHSMYVVMFGALGPLLPIQWKGRFQNDIK
ncbi:MAG: glycosyltransferase [Fidelibacterota bacterium]